MLPRAGAARPAPAREGHRDGLARKGSLHSLIRPGVYRTSGPPVGARYSVRSRRHAPRIWPKVDRRAYVNGVTLNFSRPSKPTDNALVKAFNGRLRDECPNANWFLSLVDAKSKIETWRW